MSYNTQAEAESLKKEFRFFSNLIKEHHQTSVVSYYQRPELLHNVPNSHSNSSFNRHFGRSTNFNKVYKPNLPTSKNTWLDAKNFASNNYSCKPFLSASQKAIFSANQSMPWKLNKASVCAKKTTDSFKLVRTVNSVKDAKLHNFVTPASVSDCSEQKSCNKLPKAAKVSYVTCSDCVIEISEFENGELRMCKKKVEPVAKHSKKNGSLLLGNSSVITPSSSGVAMNMECDKSVASTGVDSRDNVEYRKSLVGSESHPAALHESVPSHLASEAVKNFVETDKQCNLSPSQNLNGISKDLHSNSEISKTCNDTSSDKHQKKKPPNTNWVFQRGSVSSHSFSKFQNSCPRNAKYSKINVGNIKPSKSFCGQQLLKNKVCTKKSNALKCNSKIKYKANMKNVSQAVKYTYIAKVSPQKTSPGKVTLSSSLKNDGKILNTSSSQQNHQHQQICAKETSHIKHKTCASKLGLTATSHVGLTMMKAKALHLNSAYKFINHCNLSSRKMVKNSILSHTFKTNSRKYFRNTSNASNTVASLNLNVNPCRNSASNCRTSRPKEKFCGAKMLPYKSSSYKLKRPLNRSCSVTSHGLQSTSPLEILSRKTSVTSSCKSISDNGTPVKKAKKVRLSQTTYKVVNKHANHVSQVVKMIKTKYRTVNKRSASNSHLKWLQEQRKLYNGGKLKGSSRTRTGEKWNCSYSASVGPLRKQLLLSSKTSSGKHLLGQNKVLKKIGGITYKVSKTKINKSVTPKVMKNYFTYRSSKKNSIIQGTKLHLAASQKSVKRFGREQRNEILKRKRLGEFTYVRQKESHRNSVRSSQAQNLANRVLHKSIHTVRTAAAKKTLQKNNMFCMFFNRFGRCNKEGTCTYIHDPSKIAVCTRFLRGTCKVDKCPFSHQVSPGKMAICSFFLQGNCTNSSCPYPHTSIKPGTVLCKAFVRGYCSNGSQCKDAHIHACPQFICEGVCEKGSSCKWPHPPMKRNIKKNCDVPVSEVHEKIKEKETIAANDASDLRYFTYERELVSNQCMNDTKFVESNSQIIEKFPIINKKIKFHKQPEFIPLHFSDEEM